MSSLKFSFFIVVPNYIFEFTRMYLASTLFPLETKLAFLSLIDSLAPLYVTGKIDCFNRRGPHFKDLHPFFIRAFLFLKLVPPSCLVGPDELY